VDGDAAVDLADLVGAAVHHRVQRVVDGVVLALVPALVAVVVPHPLPRAPQAI